MKNKLSVAIATHNEEGCIGTCLSSIKHLSDEIIIVDGESTDNTELMSELYRVKFINTTNPSVFHLNKQKAIDNCTGNWILQLDADEIVTPKLAKEIEETIRQPIYDAYWIKRSKLFLGKWMKKGGQYPDPVIRLFKRGYGYLPCKAVHEQIHISGSVGWLENELIHNPNPTFETYIAKDNLYSTLASKHMTHASFIRNFLYEPFKLFFLLFIRHRGYKDGFPGLVFAMYSGLGVASAYVKYWEQKQCSTK